MHACCMHDCTLLPLHACVNNSVLPRPREALQLVEEVDEGLLVVEVEVQVRGEGRGEDGGHQHRRRAYQPRRLHSTSHYGTATSPITNPIACFLEKRERRNLSKVPKTGNFVDLIRADLTPPIEKVTAEISASVSSS
jgi:hypothetical protein